MRYFVLSFFFLLVYSSCQEQQVHSADTVKEEKAPLKEKYNSLNAAFVGDTLLHGCKATVQVYLNRYLNTDTCGIQSYDTSISGTFGGMRSIGDLNRDKKTDSVFVLPPLTFCENGQSYYFSDTSFPRLLTDSYCCYPENIFNAGDIDEDGISEIGQYYSSCVSRYKSLYVYSLKNHFWKLVGQCTYDLNYSNNNNDFKAYVKKTGRGKFQMLEITDLVADSSLSGKRNWLKYEIN